MPRRAREWIDLSQPKKGGLVRLLKWTKNYATSLFVFSLFVDLALMLEMAINPYRSVSINL